jgi:hypothetical protein
MTNHSSVPRLLPFVLLGSLLLTGACRAEEERTGDRLRAEVDRLAGVLTQLEAGPVRGAVKGLRGNLDQVRKETSPSDFVYQLRGPFVRIEMMAFIAAHQDAGKDLSKFEQLWKAEQPRFMGATRSLPAAPLLAGLAQSAENYGEKMDRAALPYGKASGPPNGLYYLAEAEGNLRFRDFVASLSLPLPAGNDAEAPDVGALQTALEGLENEMLTAFAADPGAPTMIPVSAKLKEARELLERGSRYGAALTLLECRLELSRRRPAPASQDGTPAQPEEGSLIAPFLAMAAADSDGTTARIIRSDVVPLAQSFFRRKS